MGYGAAEVKDRVEFRHNGVRFTGTVTEIDEKSQTATVTFSPGVTMLKHVEDLTVTRKALLTEDQQIEEAMRYMSMEQEPTWN